MDDLDDLSTDDIIRRMRAAADDAGLGSAFGDALLDLSVQTLMSVAGRLRTRAARHAGYADAAHTDCEHYRAQGAESALEDAAEEFERKADKLRAAISGGVGQEQQS